MANDYEFAGRWFHLVATVYGAWLPGDPRGFRTRHHREHVDGDYKSPPPAGKYDDLLKRSERRLKQPPVHIAASWRQRIGAAVRERLNDQRAFVLCLAMSGQHLHVLVKLPAGAKPRDLLGLAKKHATFVAKSHGWSGKLWGKRCKVVKIGDRSHQVNAYHYILKHEEAGAWVWRWGRGESNGENRS